MMGPNALKVSPRTLVAVPARNPVSVPSPYRAREDVAVIAGSALL
jgi:hypothetical protein